MKKKQLVILLGIVMALIASVVLFCRFVVTKKVMGDDDVRSLYSSHKEEFEKLKSMCLEDRKKSDMTYFAVSARSREEDCIRRVGSAERCQEYARLLAAAKVMRVGWEEDGVWLLVDGFGFVGGRRKGLMWRATPIPPQDARKPRRFVHVENGWYIYDVWY